MNHSTLEIQRVARGANRNGWLQLFSISMLLAILLWVPRQLVADDPPAKLPTHASVKGIKAIDSQDPAAALLLKKRQSLILGAMMLAGVLTLALLLFLWMLWWSRRTHQLLKQPLPAAGRGDELWYLKAKQDVQEATERLTVNEKQTPPPRTERGA